MARFRKINPAVLHCPELEGVSLEAEHLALMLPLACDDFGRARLDYMPLCAQLYPNHPDAIFHFPIWYGELAKSGFVTHYSVGLCTYLQMVRWDTDQRIRNPQPSPLPPPFTPGTSPGEVGEAGTHDAPEQEAESPGDPPSGALPAAGDESSPPLAATEAPMQPAMEPTLAPAPEPEIAPPQPAKPTVVDYLAQLWGTAPAAR